MAKKGSDMFRERGFRVTQSIGASGIAYQDSLACWWDASQSTSLQTSGSAVTGLNDISGNGRHLSQATGAKQPSVGSQINGRNTVVFDGTSDLLTGTPFIYSLSAYTIFMVCKMATPAGEVRIMAESNTGSTIQQLAFGNVSGGLNKFRTFYRNDANTVVLDQTSPDVCFDNTMRVITIADDQSVFDSYLYGKAQNTSAYARSATTLNVITLGGLKRTTESSWAAMTFCECRIYNRKMNAAERATVEKELYLKWYQPVETFLQIGQSNADGRGSNGSVSSAVSTFYNSAQPNLKIYYKPVVRSGGKADAGSFADDGAWWQVHKTHDGANSKTTQTVGYAASTVATQSASLHGIEPYYAYQFAQANPSSKLYIIKAAIGGSTIEGDWGVTDNATNKNWYLFKTFFYNPAVIDILALGEYPNTTKVFWMQGESDADGSTTQANYENYLQNLINRLNNELFVKPTKIIIGGLTVYYDTAGTGAQIKAAQIAVAARNSNCVMLKTDGTDGQAAIAVQGDNIHYSTSGYEVLAGRVFNS